MTALPTSMIPDVLPAPERRRVPTKRTARAPSPPPPPPAPMEEIEEVVDAPEAPEAAAPRALDAIAPEAPETSSGVVDDTADEIVIEATTQKDMEQRMTLRQLRDMCTEMGLVATGKKSDLVARVIEARQRSNAD